MAPHPALVNAILLVGCYFSRAPSLAAHESQLVTQTLYQLTNSYNQADRLHDFIRASNLLTFYYFCKGKYTEASQQIIKSTYMTVTCGLHRIMSSVWQPQMEETNHFLPPPCDNIELGERIHTLWQSFSLDKIISMATMQPAHLIGGPGMNSLLSFTTPWPRLVIEYETGNVSLSECQTVQDLYNNTTSAYGMRLETLVGLQAQGLSLAHRALYLSNQDGFPGSQSFMALDAAIENYITRLPGLRNQGALGEIVAHGGPVSPVNHQVALIRTLGYTASLITHKHVLDDVSCYRFNTAAPNLALLISELSAADYGSISIALGHIWTIAGEILVAFSRSMRGSDAHQYHSAALAVHGAMKNLSLVYPPLGFQFRHLNNIIFGTP